MLAGVCLALAAAATGGSANGAVSPAVFVPVQRFTLAWTHSIEKIRWEEDYAVIQPSAAHALPRLQPLQARIQGSGAGMEPPPDAVWRDGAYHYQPATPALHVLRLTRSGFTPDYDWCVDGRCQTLQQLIPTDGGLTLMWACEGVGAPRPLRPEIPGATGE